MAHGIQLTAGGCEPCVKNQGRRPGAQSGSPVRHARGPRSRPRRFQRATKTEDPDRDGRRIDSTHPQRSAPPVGSRRPAVLRRTLWLPPCGESAARGRARVLAAPRTSPGCPPERLEHPRAGLRFAKGAAARRRRGPLEPPTLRLAPGMLVVSWRAPMVPIRPSPLRGCGRERDEGVRGERDAARGHERGHDNRGAEQEELEDRHGALPAAGRPTEPGPAAGPRRLPVRLPGVVSEDG
jgi:hypothetical protein